MTIKQLIAQLQAVEDQDMEVVTNEIDCKTNKIGYLVMGVKFINKESGRCTLGLEPIYQAPIPSNTIIDNKKFLRDNISDFESDVMCALVILEGKTGLELKEFKCSVIKNKCFSDGVTSRTFDFNYQTNSKTC